MTKLKHYIFLFLTFILISCTIPEDKFDANKKYEVAQITQICMTLETQQTIYNKYIESFEKGIQEEYTNSIPYCGEVKLMKSAEVGQWNTICAVDLTNLSLDSIVLLPNGFIAGLLSTPAGLCSSP